MDDEILGRVTPSPVRRWMGIGMLATIGVFLVYIAVAVPPEPGWRVFLVVMGGAALWMAVRMQRATDLRLDLTATELRDSSGAVLARVDRVVSVDRGFFAFKPSNGFLIHLDAPMPPVWRPGLWWRVGRRVGVGGVTSAVETRAMAEILSAVLATRR
jgi:hypothetical protein